MHFPQRALPALVLSLWLAPFCISLAPLAQETSGGWAKYAQSPVLGGGTLGTVFDICVLKEGNTFKMWSSWRPKASIAYSESQDGLVWTQPVVVLGPTNTFWEGDLNRPVVLKKADGYHMWYTGQKDGKSWIGYAKSADGKAWTRASANPVLSPEAAWEKVAVMCPHVIWDDSAKVYKMWYSGGEQYEPDAIGYATSPDGLKWTRHTANPVFKENTAAKWEQHKVTACQVLRHEGWYYMFYIGFENIDLARIGMARSRDGIGGWERFAGNPIIQPGSGWDASACYKPSAVLDGNRWMLWYNGRNGGLEQIGVALHEGKDLGFPAPAGRPAGFSALNPADFKKYVDGFQTSWPGSKANAVPEAGAWNWMKENIPFFESSDKELEELYYFRWWTWRKHIKQTPDGLVVTEFLPDVTWAGKHNTISCPAGHHIYEGRWLHDTRILDEYSRFWFRKGGSPRAYSFWAADAVHARYLADGRKATALDLLPDVTANYRAWEGDHLDPNGLYWQMDDRDGMENSISGTYGYRPTINSYMYGDARAISALAGLKGDPTLAAEFQAKATEIKGKVESLLWDSQGSFFRTIPRNQTAFFDVREAIGLVPWYFHLPSPGKEAAWKQMTDPTGFSAPYGPTTAERRHAKFVASHAPDCCHWDGSSWPFATTQSLVGMANVLNDYTQSQITKSDYLGVLRAYARGQHKVGKPWVAENLNGLTGQWIGDYDRSVFYNHSGFADLIVTGLAGLRPRSDDQVEVNPLLPEGEMAYFALDNLPYHGRILTLLYDQAGTRYGKGKGLMVLVDGKVVASAPTLGRIVAQLDGPSGILPGKSDISPAPFRSLRAGESLELAQALPGGTSIRASDLSGKRWNLSMKVEDGRTLLSTGGLQPGAYWVYAEPSARLRAFRLLLLP